MRTPDDFTAPSFWAARERALVEEIEQTPDWHVIFRSVREVMIGDWQIELTVVHYGTRTQVVIRDRADWEHFRRYVIRRAIPSEE